MAPNNVTPNSTIGIVLVEEMIPPIIEQWTCYIRIASIEILAKIKYRSPRFTNVRTFYMEMELIAMILQLIIHLVIDMQHMRYYIF